MKEQNSGTIEKDVLVSTKDILDALANRSEPFLRSLGTEGALALHFEAAVPSNYQEFVMDSTSQEDVGFELPPAKRQCTQSPRLSPRADGQSSPPAKSDILPNPEDAESSVIVAHSTTKTISIPGLDALNDNDAEIRHSGESEPNGILDMLMQHVESAAHPTVSQNIPDAAISKQKPHDLGPQSPVREASGITANDENNSQQEGERREDDALGDVRISDRERRKLRPEEARQDIAMGDEPEPEPAVSGTEEDPSSTETRRLDPTQVEPEAAEWEADSSPLETSSDSEASDSSSSEGNSDEEMDGEYAMLGLEEQARILMQGDGGSDEEGVDHKGGDKAATQLRTANERPEEGIPKPDIKLTDENIEELGVVEGIVESTVLVRGKTSGEYQVLESGSLLCLKDRTVVGVVAELFGRVEQPMYTIRFTNDAAIHDAGLSTPGT